MKNKKVIRDAILGGCLGLILYEISTYILKIITEGFTKETIEDILKHIAIFIIFAFWFTVFSIIFRKKFNKNKELTIEEKRKILKKIRYNLAIIGSITIVLGIISLIFKASSTVSILIFANTFSILVWFLGSQLVYINFKNNKIDRGGESMKEEYINYRSKKSLIIYFSRTDENYFDGKMRYIDKGNTEIIAEYIRDITGADMFKVERKIPYSADYKTCLEESRKENSTGERPELVNYLDNIDDYEVIYIGGPVYFGVLPAPMVTQLEKLNFEEKIVRPFTTHEGSGLGTVPFQVKKLCKGAEIKEGLAIKGSLVYEARGKVENWV